MKDFIIDLEEDLEFLSLEDIELAVKMGYGYPLPGSKEKTNVPKVKLPKELNIASDEAKKEFFNSFNRAYASSKDLAKATAFALKKAKAIGKAKLEVDPTAGIVTKLEEGFKNLFSTLSGKKTIAPKTTEVVLDELGSEVIELREFKLDSQKKEDALIVAQFEVMTPAAKGILLEMLNQGRTQTVKFEDSEISARNLALKFIEEMKANPKVNLFEQKSSTKSVKNTEDFATRVDAYQKEQKCTYRIALEEVSKQDENQG